MVLHPLKRLLTDLGSITLRSGYLDTLIGYLYDYLRPRIIHENKIDILSELCVVMNIQQSNIPSKMQIDIHYKVKNYLVVIRPRYSCDRLVSFYSRRELSSRIRIFDPQHVARYPAKTCLPSTGVHSIRDPKLQTKARGLGLSCPTER